MQNMKSEDCNTAESRNATEKAHMSSPVGLELPDESPEAIARGQEMAEEIRAILAEALSEISFDEFLADRRGRP